MIAEINTTHLQSNSIASKYRAPAGLKSDVAVSQVEQSEIVDKVSLSQDAKEKESAKGKTQKGDEQNLSEDQRRQVDQLKKRDQEVKSHERAHMAAGGGLVQGGAAYTYQRGVDGKLYAVGGEVKIDTSSERDPDQTIQKMEQVKRAALAPAQPSGTDRAVAARAAQIQLQAQMEKIKESDADGEESGEEDDQNIPQLGDSEQEKDKNKGTFFNPYEASSKFTNPIGQQVNISA